MLALQITSMKHFMSQLLVSDVFDIFLLEEAVITTANTYTIDGHFHKEFFTEEDLQTSSLPDYEFTPWSNLKGVCFQLIKGKRTPLSFKFVFHLKPEQIHHLLTRSECSVDPASVKAFVLTIRYDGTKAILTTGTSFHTFLLSKEPDQLWDQTLIHYLDRKQISFELLQ